MRPIDADKLLLRIIEDAEKNNYNWAGLFEITKIEEFIGDTPTLTLSQYLYALKEERDETDRRG